MSQSTLKILLVEDEPHIAFSLKLNLEAEGFEVVHAADGPQAISDFATKGPFQAVILDVMLPELDGFEVARGIRKQDPRIGILMLTARTGEGDRLRGFESGVDDYIAKPFHWKELLARVRRMTARSTFFADGARENENILKAGHLELHYDELRLHVDGAPHPVTKLEADFLRELMRVPGKVVNREHLLEKVWGLRATTETRTIDNFVVRLRKMIEADPKDPKILLSVRGRGYKLEMT